MAEMVYAVHTRTCTYMLDEEGVCGWVVSPAGSYTEDRCIGAQFVACLDLRAPGGLVGELRVGASGLFARRESGRFILLKTSVIERVDYRSAGAYRQSADATLSAPLVAASPPAVPALPPPIAAPLPPVAATLPRLPTPPRRPTPPPPPPPPPAPPRRPSSHAPPPPPPAPAPPRRGHPHEDPYGLPYAPAFQGPDLYTSSVISLSSSDLEEIDTFSGEITVRGPLYRPDPNELVPPAPSWWDGEDGGRRRR